MVRGKRRIIRIGKPIHVDREIAGLQEWLANPSIRQRFLLDPLMRAEVKLSGTDVQSARGAAGTLEELWEWYSGDGTCIILAGNVTGWTELRQALECGYWFIRIFVRAFDLGDPANRSSSVRDNHAGLVLAHSLATCEWEMAEWVSNRMIRIPEDGAVGKLAVTPFEPAMVRLHELAYGRDASAWSSKFDLGAYSKLFASWESEAAFASALVDVCDFHLASVNVPEWYGAFERGGYRVFPVEILAIAAVRERLGLPMPKVKHSLLATPLATPPPATPCGPAPQDELVQRIVAKAEAVFGGV
jgi:hypothetical protein